MTCSSCGQIQGVGQTPAPAPAPSTSSTWMPWALGAAAAVAVGGIIYATTRHPSQHAGLTENPTRKKTPEEYRQSVVNILMHRYGFSYNKAFAAANNEEIGWKIAWFFSHNYNVTYATRMIHRRARRLLYGPWREAGYMPLGRPLPPVSGGLPSMPALPAGPPDEESMRAKYG